MEDTQIKEAIDRLIFEEKHLRAQHVLQSLDGKDAARLRELDESLDQCWDLLRQRRARREFGLDPDDVVVRERDTVEHYRQ